MIVPSMKTMRRAKAIRSSFDPAIVNVKCCNTAHSPRYRLNANNLRETQTVRVLDFPENKSAQ